MFKILLAFNKFIYANFTHKNIILNNEQRIRIKNNTQYASLCIKKSTYKYLILKPINSMLL